MITSTGLTGVETAVQQLAQDMARALPVTVVSVALLDQPGCSLQVKAMSATRPLSRPPTVGTRVPLVTAPWHRAVFDRQEPVLIEPTQRGAGIAADEFALFLVPDLRSAYLAPIRVGKELVGILGLGEMRSPDRESFTEEKRRQCHAILEDFLATSAHIWEAGRLRRQVGAMSSLLRVIGQMAEARSYRDVLGYLASEVSDWLGVGVKGVLLEIRPAGDVELLARWQLEEDIGSVEGAQLFMAFARATGYRTWPICVVDVAEDPLDPLHACTEAGATWTRIGLPLMKGDRLFGLACLYVEDRLRLADWELDALHRRAEVAATGVGLVRAHNEWASERHWQHRVAWELLTTHQRAIVQETVSGVARLLSSRLTTRFPGVTNGQTEEESAQLADAVAREVEALFAGERAALSESGASPTPWVEVNELVQCAADMVRMQAVSEGHGGHIELRLDRPTEPGVAHVSLALIGALAQAIQGAIEATEEGGRVHVRTARDGDDVVISIGHPNLDGSGRLERASSTSLFSPTMPFPSSLNLPVVRTLATAHGGDATLLPGETGGSMLVLRLPVRGPDR